MTDRQRIKKVWKRFGKGTTSLRAWVKRVKTDTTFALYLGYISPEVRSVVKKLKYGGITS